MASPAAASVRPPRPKKEPQTLVIPKNAAEEQKLKLERLMKNPDKAVPIPEKMNEWAPRAPPEFVRDVMGSVYLYSAGLVLSHRGQDFMPASTEVPVLGLAVESSTCIGTYGGESTSGRTTWMPWLRSKNWMQSFRRD
ncbi:Prkr interacting protein 1 (IL11 inducible), isoform CRA_a [Mus musculus]|nr:Prkr interacting protein 1 (IL11 inducible), isoform CRA_a [Mus musculus]